MAIVLELLLKNQRRYGYDVIQEVGRSPKKKSGLRDGALYPTLKRMGAGWSLTSKNIASWKKKKELLFKSRKIE